MHQKIKVLLKGSSLRDNTTVISSKDGKILTTEEDVKNRWREYCSDLNDHKLNVESTVLDQLWADQPQEPIPDILESEKKSAISRLSNGKAVCTDGVCPELIKHAGETAASVIYEICDRAWTEENFPAIYCKSVDTVTDTIMY